MGRSLRFAGSKMQRRRRRIHLAVITHAGVWNSLHRRIASRICRHNGLMVSFRSVIDLPLSPNEAAWRIPRHGKQSSGLNHPSRPRQGDRYRTSEKTTIISWALHVQALPATGITMFGHGIALKHKHILANYDTMPAAYRGFRRITPKCTPGFTGRRVVRLY